MAEEAVSQDIVRFILAVLLEELEAEGPVVDTPSAPFGYGADLDCVQDLTVDMDEVSGDSTLALAQALVRRLDCPRGALPDDDNYGIDLRSYLNRGTPVDELERLAGTIRGEITKDDRVRAAAVTVTPSLTGSSIAVEIRVEAKDPEVGTFTLTLAVTSAEVVLLELRR